MELVKMEARPPKKKRPLPDVWVHRTPKGSKSAGPKGGKHTEASWLWALWVLTRHEFRARYRAQALGMVWSLLYPLVMMGILSLVFTKVFRSETPNFPIWVLIGVVAWQFVGSAVNSGTGAFMAHSEIIKRTIFPRQLLPLAVMLSFGINFLLESSLLIAFIPIFPKAFSLSTALLAIPLILFWMVMLLAGVCLAFSVLNVVYRDVAYLVNTGLLILYWLTPVIYPVDIVPEPWRAVLKCNPLRGIIDGLRDAIMLGTWPSPMMWASIIVPSMLVFGIGWAIFKHYEKMVLDYV